MAAHHTRHNADAGPSRGQATSSDNPFATDNYYRLLNVPYDASTRDITKAYRQAMLRSHPDRVRADQRARAEDLSKLLNRAYSTLSNPQKRQAYDRSIRANVVQDEIMNRYVGGFGGPGMNGKMASAHAPRRQMSEAERRDRRRSDRSAMVSLFSAFAIVAITAIGLLLLYAIASLIITLAF